MHTVNIRVTEQGAEYDVYSASGQVILVCQDLTTATYLVNRLNGGHAQELDSISQTLGSAFNLLSGRSVPGLHKTTVFPDGLLSGMAGMGFAELTSTLSQILRKNYGLKECDGE